MTSMISEIKTSQEVTLPGWCGDAFICELRRPSLFALASGGAIPNPLMQTARRLFYSGISPDSGNFEEEGRILLTIARAALVKPTFEELAEHGIELTDEQLVGIYQFTQLGAKALDRFRQFTANFEPADHGEAVSLPPQ